MFWSFCRKKERKSDLRPKWKIFKRTRVGPDGRVLRETYELHNLRHRLDGYLQERLEYECMEEFKTLEEAESMMNRILYDQSAVEHLTEV